MENRSFGTWVISRSLAVLAFFNVLLSRPLKTNTKREGGRECCAFFFLSIALDFGIAGDPTEM